MRSAPVLISGLLLGLFGVLGAILVGFSHEQTVERILHNEREALLRQLRVLVPAASVDNDMLYDLTEVSAPAALGSETTHVYRGRKKGEPVAAVFSPVVTQGYSGPIKLLVAVRADGTLAGVRTIAHRETPGLGDKIEVARSDWILDFAGRSLDDPPASAWQVKKDGGTFDQFTGATITPRAVVAGVKSTLEYFAERKDRVFAAPALSKEQIDE